MITLCAWYQTNDVACDPSPILGIDNRPGFIDRGICQAHADYMRAKLEQVKPHAPTADELEDVFRP